MIEETDKKLTQTEETPVEEPKNETEAAATETPETDETSDDEDLPEDLDVEIISEDDEDLNDDDEPLIEDEPDDDNDFQAQMIASIRKNEDDDDAWWEDDEDYSRKDREELERLYTNTLSEFNENEIVKGTVTSVGEKEVVLNIGFKSEGIIPVSEFRDLEGLKPGDEVEVFVEDIEDAEGQLVLSRKRAKNLRSWERINASMDSDVVIQGFIMRRTKGGFVVDVDGIEAFLPGSQIDVKPVRDFDQYVGRTMEFKVVKINHAYENVVVSHKVLIEEKLEEQRKEILQNLEKGQVLEGMVKNMTNFGVFIDLGGVDGLLHITDISWGRINHPEEVLELDQKVNVVVLDFDDEKKRISLGMKQLTPHPWESLPENIQEGTVVKGRIVTIADYGIFLEIMPGVEGLIHTSEMTWSQHAKNPLENFQVGSELEAKVLSIDRDERKMSLGLKQLVEDPWERIIEKYPVGSSHTGLVRNMTNYGLFVELEEGVDGLVHISDLSWTKKFNHPSEYVKEGENLEVVVLDIDKDNRRLSLGHKQLTEDVWETFASIFTVGSEHKGTIKKIDSKGAVVELEYGVEGTVPTKHLKVADGAAELKVDDTAPFVVIEFNKDAKRLVLSHTKVWRIEDSGDRDRDRDRGGKKSSRKAATTPSAKAGTTTLGDIDALAQLKKEMEAQESQSQKAPAKKKAAQVEMEPEEEQATAEPVDETVSSEAENAPEIDNNDEAED